MKEILIVDDDADVRDTLEEYILSAGYSVRTACNGFEAIEMVYEQQPDVILMDIIMPDKEGIETIIELKKHHREIPIIAMSGGGRISPKMYLETAEYVGVYGVIQKPFKISSLLKMIKGAEDADGMRNGDFIQLT